MANSELVVDLIDQAVWERGVPYETFARLRAESPVHWHPEPDGQGFWAVTRHADVKAISQNPTDFSSREKGVSRLDPATQDELDQYRAVLIAMDPPEHRDLRGMVNKSFTPAGIAGLEGVVREYTRGVLDVALEKGEIDFVADYAANVPTHTISELMGVPEEDRNRLYELSNGLIDDQDPEVAPTADFRMTASTEAFMIAQRLAESDREAPGHTLTTQLLQADFAGRSLTDLEFNLFFIFLMVAGNETTRTAASGGLITLLEHPEAYAKVAADPSLLPAAIEEMVRYWPPIHHFRRTAMRDLELGGQQIREGDKVLMWYPAANRDEEMFANPNTFDITRDPNEHLSYGVGEHFCLGASLARLELRVMFEELLSRVDKIEMLAPPRRLRSNLINGIKEMRVQLTPR